MVACYSTLLHYAFLFLLTMYVGNYFIAVHKELPHFFGQLQEYYTSAPCLFICFPTDDHLGCFQTFAVIVSAVIDNAGHCCVLSYSAPTESEFLGLCLFMKASWLNVMYGDPYLRQLFLRPSEAFILYTLAPCYFLRGCHLRRSGLPLGPAVLSGLERVSRCVTNIFSWTYCSCFITTHYWFSESSFSMSQIFLSLDGSYHSW